MNTFTTTDGTSIHYICTRAHIVANSTCQKEILAWMASERPMRHDRQRYNRALPPFRRDRNRRHYFDHCIPRH